MQECAFIVGCLLIGQVITFIRFQSMSDDIRLLRADIRNHKHHEYADGSHTHDYRYMMRWELDSYESRLKSQLEIQRLKWEAAKP